MKVSSKSLILLARFCGVSKDSWLRKPDFISLCLTSLINTQYKQVEMCQTRPLQVESMTTIDHGNSGSCSKGHSSQTYADSNSSENLGQKQNALLTCVCLLRH